MELCFWRSPAEPSQPSSCLHPLWHSGTRPERVLVHPFRRKRGLLSKGKTVLFQHYQWIRSKVGVGGREFQFKCRFFSGTTTSSRRSQQLHLAWIRQMIFNPIQSFQLIDMRRFPRQTGLTATKPSCRSDGGRAPRSIPRSLDDRSVSGDLISMSKMLWLTKD